MQAEDIWAYWLAQARQQLQRLPYVLSPFSSTAPANAAHPGDSWLGGRPFNIKEFSWLAIWPLALLFAVYLLRGASEQPVRYRVPSPRTPEKKELLSNPSIKVCAPSGPQWHGHHD